MVHVHPYGVDFFPGPRDYSIPRNWRIPVWGISPAGVWRIDPGPPITVNLVGDKSKWGGAFNKAKWEKEANGPPPPPCKKVP